MEVKRGVIKRDVTRRIISKDTTRECRVGEKFTFSTGGYAGCTRVRFDRDGLECDLSTFDYRIVEEKKETMDAVTTKLVSTRDGCAIPSGSPFKVLFTTMDGVLGRTRFGKEVLFHNSEFKLREPKYVRLKFHGFRAAHFYTVVSSDVEDVLAAVKKCVFEFIGGTDGRKVVNTLDNPLLSIVWEKIPDEILEKNGLHYDTEHNCRSWETIEIDNNVELDVLVGMLKELESLVSELKKGELENTLRQIRSVATGALRLTRW